MKKGFLFMVLMLLMGARIAVNAQELTASDVQNSGCMRGTRARANENEQRRTIILTKEGDILSVQLLGFEADCCISGFDVKSNMKDGSETMPCLLSVSVGSYSDEEEDCDCICPYNISFTINGVEVNGFRFSCWWYDGLVSLTEGEPLALEDIKEDVSIDGTIYTLDKVAHTAKLRRKNAGESEVNIPSELSYEGQEYTVNSIGSYVFHSNAALTSVTIPGSITYIGEAAFYGCSNLKDICCQADNVPVTGRWVFDNTPIASATLHVPAGSIDKYKTTSPWSEFGNIVALPEQYYPEGTKWTEIRLDTLKYDSWYSKVDGEWVPNFETIEYRVQGKYLDERYNDKYSCVYTNGPEWTDSLTLLLYDHRIGNNDVGWCGEVTVAAFDNNGQLIWPFWGVMYPMSFEVGTEMSSLNIKIAGATGGGWPWAWDEYGTVEEIKEGDFGGVRPLKYSDVNGIRFIQTIGVTTWNDGECVFGPIRPYEVFSAFNWELYPYPRHYRSMLVHFERDGEVLYDVWPKKEAIIEESVTFTKDQMATIILPTEPDASKGKYYRLDRVEGNEIIFEQELQPQARVPYIIVPSEDFCIDPSSLDLEGLTKDSVSIEGVSFIGSYTSKELPALTGGDGGGSLYYDIIDKTPDCSLSPFGETGKGAIIGALRAYLLVHWEDPYHHGGTKVPGEKMEIALKDDPNGIKTLSNSPLKGEDIYDLSGRKMANGELPSGVYLKSRRKILIK